MWILLGLFIWILAGFIYVHVTKGKSDESLSEFILLLPSGALCYLILWAIGFDFDRKNDEED